MGRFIIQPEPKRDLYILWSTVTDSPLIGGSRNHLEAVLLLDSIEEAKRNIDYMFNAANVSTSTREGVIYGGSHWLPAKNFLAAAERIRIDPDADLSDLLEEIEE